MKSKGQTLTTVAREMAPMTRRHFRWIGTPTLTPQGSLLSDASLDIPSCRRSLEEHPVALSTRTDNESITRLNRYNP